MKTIYLLISCWLLTFFLFAPLFATPRADVTGNAVQQDVGVQFHVSDPFVRDLYLGATQVTQGVTVTMSWDAALPTDTWKQVNAYEHMTDGTYVLLGSTPCPGCMSIVVPNVTKVQHTYVVRSFDGIWESPDSNAVTITPPKAPNVLKLVIR
jgi:hypothetical protein